MSSASVFVSSDVTLDGVPISRVALHQGSGQLLITSRREGGAWDTHGAMKLVVRDDELQLPISCSCRAAVTYSSK